MGKLRTCTYAASLQALLCLPGKIGKGHERCFSQHAVVLPLHRIKDATWAFHSATHLTLMAFMTEIVSFLVAYSSSVRYLCSGRTTCCSSSSPGYSAHHLISSCSRQTGAGKVSSSGSHTAAVTQQQSCRSSTNPAARQQRELRPAKEQSG